MHERIISELRRIEESHSIRILYACESGSRAWGFPSRNSDYDVRFIYIHPPDWYLSIQEKRDVIELPVSELLDINGWELRKALKLLRKSNPPILEWMESPIVYLETYSTIQKMRNLSRISFSPLSCLYHYLSIARGNFGKYLQGDKVKIKKYFYALRPIFACKWIEENNTMPPMEFEELIRASHPDDILADEINKLLERKISGEELDYGTQINVLNQFLEEQIQHFGSYLKSVGRKEPAEEELFDQIFIDALKEVWSPP
ncbi:MAG: nucleotidyltransferase domain-containing protein [Candidatus Methanoperedens sp.]|nr:nucleotidyltransferase domain-containing protein [Candidatus Methanoperedens sp.]